MYSLAVPSQFVGPFGTNNAGIFFAFRSGNLDFVNNVDTVGAISAPYPAINQWHHIALVRNSSNVRSYYINGTRVGTLSNSADFNQTQITVGNTSWNGYVSNFRVIVGSNIDNPNSSTITVPTAPTTAVSGTQLLLCQTPTPLVDKSTNAFAITVNGNAKASEVGPFTSATAGKGGLVWVKGRNETFYHRLASSPGPTLPNYLASNATDAASSGNGTISAFTTTGFTVSAGGGGTNTSSYNYVGWTFRKQPKFFDVVTYTGNQVAGRTVAHNLGSVPGFIACKRTDTPDEWFCYHRSLGPSQQILLNSTATAGTNNNQWNNTAPTSSVFSLGTDSGANGTGGTYVAYLFAHNAGGFGLTGTDNVVSCGSFAVGGGSDGVVTLGYEPQWVMFKQAAVGGSGNWRIVDNMRGVATGGSASIIAANSSAAETSSSNMITFNATGFVVKDGSVQGGDPYVYIAIRRGPMKVPTDATTVFSPVAVNSPGGTPNTLTRTTNFPVDFYLDAVRNQTFNKFAVGSRMQGRDAYLFTSNTGQEQQYGDLINNLWDSNTGVGIYDTNGTWNGNNSSQTTILEAFRRAPSFFDVVCWTGNDVAPRNINHNLTVVPEMMIVKGRSNVGGTNWIVYHKDLTSALYYLSLNNADAQATGSNVWRSTAPTASVFTVGSDSWVNTSGDTFVNYLFATCPGVSKVGSYTGDGSTNETKRPACGFTGGARFLMIKRTNATGNWYIWDTARGFIFDSYNAYLMFNNTAAETTSTAVGPIAGGFYVNQQDTTNLNVNGATYIFLAIA
jgi:hypothetical protein